MRKFFDRGDVVFLDFDPSLGHEQKGRRPALILTKKIFNEQLVLFVAIKSKLLIYPLEIAN